MDEDRDQRGRQPFKEWVAGVPEEVTGDSIWKIRAYQLSLYACDIGWPDVTVLIRDQRTISLGDQLYRALGSISANIAEGYSRGTGRDRARFYEYALGSARESRDWYFKARVLLGHQVTNHRLVLLGQIIRLLLTMIPDQRGRGIGEAVSSYVDDDDEMPHDNGE
jgi:four helix bundle protein